MKKIYGNHCLIVTPMNEKREIDEESTRSLVDYVIDKGVHGILALGSTGEVFALTEAERKRFIEIIVDQAAGRVPIGVGVNDSATDVAVLLTVHAEEAGVDYIFTCPPYYHPHREVGVFNHIKAIADATSLPVMVYDGGAGIEISLPLLKKMAYAMPNLKSAKLFLPYPPKIAAYAEATDGKIEPFAGHDQMNYLMLLYGANGMTSAASNVIPKEQSDMFDFIQEGKLKQARAIFLGKIAPLNAIAFANVLQYPQAYKHSLKLMGVIKHDTCKVVMEPISDIRKRELHEAMEYIGLL